MKSLVSKGLVMQSREDIINHNSTSWNNTSFYTP